MNLSPYMVGKFRYCITTVVSAQLVSTVTKLTHDAHNIGETNIANCRTVIRFQRRGRRKPRTIRSLTITQWPQFHVTFADKAGPQFQIRSRHKLASFFGSTWCLEFLVCVSRVYVSAPQYLLQVLIARSSSYYRSSPSLYPLN
jgi:hypothetical protein